MKKFVQLSQAIASSPIRMSVFALLVGLGVGIGMGIGFASGGSVAASLNTAYRNILHKAEGPARGPVVGRMGKLIVHSASVNYAPGLGSVLTADEIHALRGPLRRAYIRKVLLRRYIVDRALRENVFADDAAARFVLPRLERILEEYFLRKQARYHLIEQKYARLSMDDTVLSQWHARRRASRGVVRAGTLAQARRMRDRMTRRLIQRNKRRARSRVIRTLLRRAPAMRIQSNLKRPRIGMSGVSP